MTEIRPVLYVVVIPDAIDGRTGKGKRLSAQLRIGSDPAVEFGLQFYAFLGTGFRRPDPTDYGIDQLYALRDRGGLRRTILLGKREARQHFQRVADLERIAVFMDCNCLRTIVHVDIAGIIRFTIIIEIIRDLFAAEGLSLQIQDVIPSDFLIEFKADIRDTVLKFRRVTCYLDGDGIIRTYKRDCGKTAQRRKNTDQKA